MASSEVADYLARAREAEKSAKEAHSPVFRRAWEVIAGEYRELAAQSQKNMSKEDVAARSER